VLSRLILWLYVKRFSVRIYRVLQAPHGEQRVGLVVGALKIRPSIVSCVGKLMKELLTLGELSSLKQRARQSEL
jgi:hypothetical protein